MIAAMTRETLQENPDAESQQPESQQPESQQPESRQSETLETEWLLLFGAWGIAAVATAGSLFFSEVMGLPPCILCWYQRICLFPLVVILARKDMHFWKRQSRRYGNNKDHL